MQFVPQQITDEEMGRRVFSPIGGKGQILGDSHLVDLRPRVTAGRGDQAVDVAPVEFPAAEPSPDAGARRSSPDRTATVVTAA